MPKLDGLEVCKRLRASRETAQIPIIMLTARAAETDKVVGLELGADDYLTKPFSPPNWWRGSRRSCVDRCRSRMRSRWFGAENSASTFPEAA